VTVSDGSPFPERDLILFLTFCAILATLVLQGLTLGPLISALRLKSEGEADKVEELETRLEGTRAALERLEQQGGERVSSKLIKAEREAVLSRRDRGEVSPEVMRRVMRDLDLEESRLDG
jgi:monovalent cation/hydrogen antiporter